MSIVAAALVPIASAQAQTRNVLSEAAVPRIAIGMNAANTPTDPVGLKAYVATAGRKPAFVMWYQNWSEPLFWESQRSSVDAANVTPLITWMPKLSDGGGVPLADIASGKWDDKIRTAAQQATSWHRPVYIRFGHEMNLPGSAYGPGRQGNTPAGYVAAWRHVVSVFRAMGVTNVRWVWSPNVDCDGRCPFTAFYPGDDVVDWVALDGYNFSSVTAMPWRSLMSVFGPSYDKITAITTKPVMIGETGSAEVGGSKEAWIRDGFLTKLPVRMPRVRAVVWFHRVKETDWRIDSSPTSLAAYRAVVDSERYQGSLP